jgi:hypothetical protein
MSKWRAGRTSDRQPAPTKAHRVQRFPPKRLCAAEGCATVLSIYNATLFCSLHARPATWVVNRPFTA